MEIYWTKDEISYYHRKTKRMIKTENRNSIPFIIDWDGVLIDEINEFMTTNNFDELSIFMAGRQLKVVNEYTATINDKNAVFSPIECLTCDVNVILPDINKSYWDELLAMYDELIELEPNAIRFQQERNLVKDVLNKLNKEEVYITGENNE